MESGFEISEVSGRGRVACQSSKEHHGEAIVETGRRSGDVGEEASWRTGWLARLDETSEAGKEVTK